MKEQRPPKLSGTTYQEKCGCGAIYITCNDKDDTLFEVFLTLGKAGGCGAANKEALGKLISIALRSGTSPESIIKSLNGVSCPRTNEVLNIPSCITCIARSIQFHETSKKEI